MAGHTTENAEPTPPSSRSDTPTNANTRTDLSSYEIEGEGRPPFILSYPEVKLLGIAGVRFCVTRLPRTSFLTLYSRLVSSSMVSIHVICSFLNLTDVSVQLMTFSSST